MATPGIQSYLTSGSAQQKSLYGKKVDDKTLAEFIAAKNPIEYLTGDFSVGAQNQQAAMELSKQLSEYSANLYNTKKAEFAAKGINLDTYLDPSHQLYSAGEGAASNRGSDLMRTQLLAKAQQDAIRLAGAGGAAPDYKAQLQAQYAQADALAKKAFRDPSLRANADRILNLIKGLDINTGVSQDVLKQENAAAARVAATLPNAGAGIGAVAPGGPIDNSAIGNAGNYENIAAAARAGVSPSVNQGTGQTPQGPANNILFENGSYVFGGKAYQTLEAAKAAASRSGQTPVYNPPAADSYMNLPSRGNYISGPSGDRQYQLALDRYNAQKEGKQWTTPTKLSEVKTAEEFDQFANAQAESLLQQATQSGSAPPTRSQSTGLGTTDDFLNEILQGGGDKAPAPYNAEQKLAEVRGKYGVDPLEQELAALDKEAFDIKAIMRANVGFEQGKAVGLGVMSGRISEEEKQANIRLDAINSQKTIIANQLQQKYGVIDGIMKASQLDFENATKAYEQEFDRVVTTTNLLRGLRSDQISMEEKARDDARSNVTIVTNALSSGALTWDSLDPATKASYAKLEAQAGLPIGTIQSFTAKPSKDWQMQTILPGIDQSGNQVATIIEKNQVTGEFKTTKLVTDYAPKPSSSSSALQKGSYTDPSGNLITYQVNPDGTITQQTVGKSNVNLNDPNSKAQNDFEKYRADLILAMNKTDTYGTPLMTYDKAAAALKAKYPTLTDEAISYYLTGQ